MDTAAVKIKMPAMQWVFRPLGVGQRMTLRFQRPLHMVQASTMASSFDTNVFTFLPVPLDPASEGDSVLGDTKGEYPYGLEPVLPGSHLGAEATGAILSYRRVVTLRIWADSHLGVNEMGITRADAFAFRSETARTMFATFWNGVRVDPCTIEEMQAYRTGG